MNKRQRPEAQALLRASDFVLTRQPDFTHDPANKVDLKFNSACNRLSAAITTLGGKQTIQAGGAYSEETELQAILRDELLDELRDINQTAAAIAEETRNPALMERFRMPYGQSDNGLTISARAMAAAIREYGLNDEFEAHGHPEDAAGDLEELAAEFDQKEGEQGTALGQRTGATAAIPGALRSGKAAIKTLNAIFRRVYKEDVEALTAWRTACHVQRAARAVAPVPVAS